MTTAPIAMFDPAVPPPATGGGIFLYAHPHEWEEIAAQLNPNGTWSSVFRCAVCTDVATGSRVGPVPPGFCPCGWVQRDPDRARCEDCDRPLTPPGDR